MPNYVKREQELLNPDQLLLAAQSRQPALGAVDDSALMILIAELRRINDGADTTEAGQMLSAALRRAEAERRKRGLRLPGATPVVPAPVATPAKPKAATATKRKSATVPRTPAGRKPTETRKTDLRTEPHRVPKRRAKPDAAQVTTAPAGPTPDPVTRKSVMSDTEAQKATKQAARKGQTDAEKVAEKAAAQAARKAEKLAVKQAEKDAAKAVRDAEKEAAKDQRRAARKVEKKAEKAAATAAQKAEKKSAKADAKPVKAKADKLAADEPAKEKPAKEKKAKTGPAKPKKSK